MNGRIPAAGPGRGGPSPRGARPTSVHPGREVVTMTTRLLVGVVLGGMIGFGLYRFVGCASGACPITSNPWVSTIYGMLMGALLSGAL